MGKSGKKSLPAGGESCTHIFAPKWWNWSTREVQGLVLATEWEFDSPLRHQWKARLVAIPAFSCFRGRAVPMPVMDDRRWRAAALPRLFCIQALPAGCPRSRHGHGRRKKERASFQMEEARSFLCIAEAGAAVRCCREGSRGRARSPQGCGQRAGAAQALSKGFVSLQSASAIPRARAGRRAGTDGAGPASRNRGGCRKNRGVPAAGAGPCCRVPAAA